MTDLNPAAGVALDARNLNALKNAAARNPQDALKSAAVQFEALFLNQLLRSMREAMPKDGMLHSSAGDSYTSMYDQQLAQRMAAQGTGLARMIEKQLAGHLAKTAVNGNANPILPAQSGAAPGSFAQPVAPPIKAASAALQVAPAATSSSQNDFLHTVMQYARQAAAGTALSPMFIAAQAALESGWGKREIRAADGTASHNLFGIKAGSGWKGATVDVATTEYVNGIAQQAVAKFRAYSSYAEGLGDYVALLTQNPRYGEAVTNARDAQGFAQGLQRAGYATDPAYASKLTQVIAHAARLTRSA